MTPCTPDREAREQLPRRIGLCPVHQEEFFYPLADEETLGCPSCGLEMTEYVRVDALLGQPDPEVEAAVEALDWAKAPTTDDALTGVERRIGMESQGYSLAGRIRALYSRERIEANRQRGRAKRAEERLRAVTGAVQEVVDAFMAGPPLGEGQLGFALHRLRAVLSEEV